jgi:lipoprotein-anchoring transpeptidase ErfK/SrfK
VHGRSTRSVRRIWAWIGAATALILLLTAGGTAAAARFDERHDEEFLPGVTVNGIPIGGMTTDAAYRVLAASVEAPLDRPVTVISAGHSVSVTPRQLGVRTDLRSRLDQAASQQRKTPVASRVWHRLTGSPIGAHFEVKPSVDEAPIRAFVGQMAAAVDLPARNSVPQLASGDTLQFTPAVAGRALDQGRAAETIATALRNGETTAALEVQPVAPTATPASFPDVLAVKIGDNKLLHFHDGQLVKTYDVATGSQRYPTPTGLLKIVTKRFRPTWVNPAKYPGGWGASLPARIGPGPDNPLGTRAMNLGVAGILIHGTSNVSSLGYNVSHGCVRMRMSEVEELYDLVGVGTPVIVEQTAPMRSQPAAPAAPTLEDLAEAHVTQLPAAPAPAAPAPAAPAAPSGPTASAPAAPAATPGAPGAVSPATPGSETPVLAPGSTPSLSPSDPPGSAIPGVPGTSPSPQGLPALPSPGG